MKLYFAHYERVTSMNREDAIKLCEDALTNKRYDLNRYPTSKLLKKVNSRDTGYMRVGKKNVNVHHCLDWKDNEWSELLENLRNTTARIGTT